MFVDGRQIDTAELSTDICVIGAGAAGIALALDLSAKQVDVLLLESGGYEPDPETQSLYEGENVGFAYERLDQARSRYLGGSTNCWGGWCRPLDPLDFEARPWIENSGWPITYEQMAPWYEKSHPLLQLRKPSYSPADWAEQLGYKGGALFPLDGQAIVNIIDQFSPPARFGRLYRQALARTPGLKVLLHANVTEITANADANAIETVRVETLNGRRLKVSAKQFVLATGGIENARLLLASNSVESCGVGNRRDLVGRYFMDHPRAPANTVRLVDHKSHRALYDVTVSKARQVIGGDQGLICAHVAPSRETQVTQGLPNARTYLGARRPFENSAAYLSLKELRRLWRGRKYFGYTGGDFAKAILKELPHLANVPAEIMGLIDARLDIGIRPRRFKLVTILEPTPNRDSRVTLSLDRDRLSLPRAVVNWKLTSRDRSNFESINKLMLRELSRQGMITIEPDDDDGTDFWSTNLMGCWHHMGTTRMSADPAAGVVDANCRVHDYANLYIAGSSVFPTVGSDMPTVTVVALALRLGAHLRERLSAHRE